MKNIKIVLALLIIFMGSMNTGCKKFVDVGQPKNQLLSSEVFADSTDASGAVVGIYISAISGTLSINSGGQTLYPGLSADELVPTGNSTSIIQFYNNNILTDNNSNNGLWVAAYNYIYAANACLEGISNSSGISNTAKIKISAEARYIRGYEYFALLNIYGGVPLVTGTDYKTTDLLPRSSVSEIYNEIIADLQFAELNLGTNTGSNDRPNSLTASAVLAKVYLYLAKYNEALAEASKVISSNNYALEMNLNNVFLAGSSEIIWQFDLPFNKYNWEGQTFVPSSSKAVPKYVLTGDLYNSFESGDQRLANWTKTNLVATKSYTYPFKYKNNALSVLVSENYVLIRLAELYLIRAEAEINTGDLNGGMNDINLIRNRAGLSGIPTTTSVAALAAVQNERRHELFCEGGNRWFDLKRWNMATSILSVEKTTWNANAQLYPIPIYQINTNAALIQNPGY